MSPPRSEYSVGWICPLPVELAAAQEMLNEEHVGLECGLYDKDENLYTFGSISGHNGVIVFLPAGQTGNTMELAKGEQMRCTLQGVLFGLMVGTGGGFQSVEADIRLGDVVVGQPHRAACCKLGRITALRCDKTGHTPLLKDLYLGRQMYNHYSTDTSSARHMCKSEHQAALLRGRVALKERTNSAPGRDKVNSKLSVMISYDVEATGLVTNLAGLKLNDNSDAWDSIITLQQPITLQELAHSKVKIVHASEGTHPSTLLGGESVSSVQSGVETPGTESLYDDYSAKETAPLVQALQSRRLDLVELSYPKLATRGAGICRVCGGSQCKCGHGSIGVSGSRNDLSQEHSTHQISSHDNFLADPAHEYWTWSRSHGNWWHKDGQSNAITWAPLDFD
jgi:hypothetical protein